MKTITHLLRLPSPRGKPQPHGQPDLPLRGGAASAHVPVAAVRTHGLQVVCQRLQELGFPPSACCLSFLNLKTRRRLSCVQPSCWEELPPSYCSPKSCLSLLSLSPAPPLMKSSQQRLHNGCRGLSCVMLGARPMFPFIDKSPPHCQVELSVATTTKQDERKESQSPRALPPSSPSSP